MLIKSGNREDAIHALINTWLKDKTLKCGWCGAKFERTTFPCCDQPFIGTNFDIMSQFNKEMKMSRDTRKNVYASNESKNMRWKLSFPPTLLQWLIESFKKMYGEDLFTEEYNTTWFAKKFRKYFAVPERI